MDSAALEQMNKLRKSLGLPSLNLPGSTDTDTTAASGPKFKSKGENDADEDGDEPASTLESREAAGYANFKQIQDDEKKRLDREKRKAAIQKARELAARSVKLEGRGLGDADENLDAKSWLKGQKNRQKEIEAERARKKLEELEEQERLAAIQYTSRDLAGVQVAHEIGDFDDGIGEQILTLQDKEIGKDDEDDEDDILENADITAKDKLKEKLDLKKKIVYDVHDTEQQSLLSQYDEKKRKAFTLDESGGGALSEERESKRQQIGEKLRNTISLDILKPELVSDYLEIKIKKPKKAKKNKRTKAVDEDDGIFPVSSIDNMDEMDVDGGVQEIKLKPKFSEPIFNDDDDLATALSFTRRAALKKQKRKPEDIARELKQEEANSPEQEVEQGIVLDDTTTFLDNLATRPPEEQLEKIQRSIEPIRPESPEPSSPADHEMTDIHPVDGNEEELLDRLRREQAAHTPEVPQTGLDEEKSLDQGLGAALSLLKQRGLVKSAADAAADKVALHRDRQKFILEAQLRDHETEARARAQRERDRASGKLANMSVREREEHARWVNSQREHQSSVAAAAAFNREYKPDVTLKYVDDKGRVMNQKEAFKHLSHQFHGKGSGKGKTEKAIKKVDEEKRREARSVLDASGEAGRGYEGAAQHQRKGGQAGVRLQ